MDHIPYDELLNTGQERMSDIDSIIPEELQLKMPKNNLMDRLWTLWKMYIDYYVVGNHELKQVMFHSVMGTILTEKGYKYVVSGETFCSTRIHTFIIQQSGTGKSQMMKGYNNLINYVGINCRYTTHDNESFLIGSTDEKKDENDEPMMKPGALSTLYSLCWDEGEILLSKSVPFLNVEVVTAQFQSVMDEPGEVKGKGMRQGSISYPSNTTLIAGSYMFDQFKQVMLQKGFLQRMNIFFKVFTDQEMDDITIGIELMKLQNNPKKIQRIKAKFKDTVAEIPKCSTVLHFQKEAVYKWIPIKMELKNKYIKNAYTGEKQDTLNTFFNRFHNLVDKMACQHAILMGRKTVMFDDILYGKSQAMTHLNCVLSCFDNVKTDAKVDINQVRRNTITDIVKKYPGIKQIQLMIELRTKKDKGKWDLGSNRTHEVIKDMCKPKGGNLRLEIGEKNCKFLHLKQ